MAKKQKKKTLICVKINSKIKQKHSGLLFSSFCSFSNLTWEPCQHVALLTAVVGHMLPCGWQQTQTVYFVCTAKLLRLGSPFLFSQWKGEIDRYHLCGTALFERYQTFHRHHWILSWANKHTRTHTHTESFILSSIFYFCCRQGEGWGMSFSCAHLRHICWFMCNHAFLLQWLKCIDEQMIKLRAALYYVTTSWEEVWYSKHTPPLSEELLAFSYEW